MKTPLTPPAPSLGRASRQPDNPALDYPTVHPSAYHRPQPSAAVYRLLHRDVRLLTRQPWTLPAMPGRLLGAPSTPGAPGAPGAPAFPDQALCREAFLLGQARSDPGLSGAEPDWRALCVPVPPCPWTEEPDQSTPPWLVALCWRYGWVVGTFSAMRAQPSSFLSLVFAPWGIGIPLADLPLVPPPQPVGLVLQAAPKFRDHPRNTPKRYRILCAPAWRDFIADEIGCHDIDGQRQRTTEYWPVFPVLPVQGIE